MNLSEEDLKRLVQEFAVEFKRCVYGKSFGLIRVLPERAILQKLILLYLTFSGASNFMAIVRVLNLHQTSVHVALRELERKGLIFLDDAFCWRIKEN